MDWVLLPADFFFAILILGVAGFLFWAKRNEYWRSALFLVLQSRTAVACISVLSIFFVVAVLDSLHFRTQNSTSKSYAGEIFSLLDECFIQLKNQPERTYSAPLAITAFVKETNEALGIREAPRLVYGGAALGADTTQHTKDVLVTSTKGAAFGLGIWLLLVLLSYRLRCSTPHIAWNAAYGTLLAIFLIGGAMVLLAQKYHIMGTDKVGQDIFYLVLKAIRTGVLVGTLTTLIMLPAAVMLGILAGYLGGWVDDVVQYLYTVLNSIPSVLLIAAAVLMMQVIIDLHPQWFSNAAVRADARLLALCAILGVTSWTGLCRLLRGETLKLREMEYIQAARAFGVGKVAIMVRHILPNLSHIILITAVMDFSMLVLAEVILSFVGIGVDPNTVSFGGIINSARLELVMEPPVWWPLTFVFLFMFLLVLSANLLLDVMRSAFDPRSSASRRG